MKSFYFLTLLFFINAHQGNAQLQLLWANSYPDSSASFLYVNDFAVDGAGNSYLAGYKQFPGDEYYEKHLFVQKLNGDGKLQWIRYFNKAFDSIDVANAIALDKSGNIYVTGARIDTFCNICTYSTRLSDIITMKYDKDGNRLWLNRYHDSLLKLASPADIALAADGSILVTGNVLVYSPEIGTYINSLLVQKIRNSGATQWVRKVQNYVGNAGCFDNLGNILIAGAADADNLYQTQKPLVTKFNKSGTQLWKAAFEEPGKNGRFYFIGCDSANNIFANGQTDTLAFYNNPRIVTVRYKPNGQQVWFRKEQNHSNISNFASGGFKVDAAGNTYLTGYTNLSFYDENWLTTKYNLLGVRQWKATFDDRFHGSDRPAGIAVDNDGRTFVTGSSYTQNPDYSFTTIAYGSQGNILAKSIFKYGSFPSGIGLDEKGRIYVGGAFGINQTYPATGTLKYELNGALSISEAASAAKNDFIIFPNPVKNQLSISMKTTLPGTGYKLMISDVAANSILTKEINTREKNIMIDVQSLKTGVYTATISNGSVLFSKTFIKQ